MFVYFNKNKSTLLPEKTAIYLTKPYSNKGEQQLACKQDLKNFLTGSLSQSLTHFYEPVVAKHILPGIFAKAWKSRSIVLMQAFLYSAAASSTFMADPWCIVLTSVHLVQGMSTHISCTFLGATSHPQRNFHRCVFVLCSKQCNITHSSPTVTHMYCKHCTTASTAMKMLAQFFKCRHDCGSECESMAH